MREQATRLIALVVLLLGGACIVFGHGERVSAASQRDRTTTIYLPIVHIRATQPTSDLQIVHLGLYQSVQNHSNDVPLVAHKPALLRVYAQASTQSGTVPLAAVTVDAHRNGQLLGSISADAEHVSVAPSVDDLDSTFNFNLPDAWLEGDVTLTATIDSPDAVPELNEANNALQASFAFHAVPALDLTIVPIQYIDTVTGVTFYVAGHDPVSEWLLSAFPISEVNVTIHEPLTFTGDLRQGGEWSRLLDAVTALWAVEAGPGSAHIYYGLVPNSTPSGDSWFGGGVSGLGWIGQRVSLGLDVGEFTGESAGHEIGHNFGRRHAPCGSPSGVDPHFPYPNASIGVYGVDVTDDTLMDPEQTHDVMSYCGPEWVSDYTYKGLFQDQSVRGSRMGNRGEGLLVSARLDGDKVESFAAYRLNQPFMPTDRSNGYQVQLLDDKGISLGVFPAELYQAEETGVSTQMLLAHVPLAGLQADRVDSVRFLVGGALLVERTISDDLK